jgi:uncharacterized protein (DUF1800 family)
MNRRDFLASIKPKSVSGLKKVTASGGLQPYAGPWTRNEIAHLLKRTMFGATKTDIDYFLPGNVNDAVDELLNNVITVSPPLRDYGLLETEDGMFDDPGTARGQTWINDLNKPSDPGLRSKLNSVRIDSMRKWWVGLMLHQNRSITEKMVLFWHHHFSVQKEEVENHIPMYRHHDLLRRNALGNVRQLTKDVSIDPAMLVHLNGYLNSKLAPDENFARELQELFTVGKGVNSLYTEDDVIAAARVLTGWRVNSDTFLPYHDGANHDAGNKTFSAFYKNTVITGSSDALDELDRFINMIFATDECPKFICRKIYRWFVNSIIDDDTEANVIAPLATIFKNSNFEIKPVLEALFKSEHFFDPVNRACYIKSPYDFIVGTLREFGAAFPPYTDYENGYPLFYSVYVSAANMQQDLFQPPDVSGWPAYHQEPMFYELWVNSNSLPRRADFTNNMIEQGLVDLRAFTNTVSDPSDPDKLIDEVSALLLRYPLSDNSKTYVKNNFLLNNSNDNSVWTDLWNANNSAAINGALKKLYLFLTNLPEFHLC